jgi:gamma-glutamylcyclotransferase (GGCT)/AIG2-like uncharacterized protein YtfP
MEQRDKVYAFFYGSLLSDLPARKALSIEDYLEYVGNCSIKGSLYDLGDYPGLHLEGEGEVRGELYELKEEDCFQILDDFENYHSNDPGESLYLRKTIWIPEVEKEAWVYEYQGSLHEKKQVVSGDWRQYIHASGKHL